MIYRHTDEQIEAYELAEAINQSSLKVIIDPYKGMEYFIDNRDSLFSQEDLYYEEKKHFIVGKAVDYFLSQGQEAFKNKYHYSDLKKKPSDAVKSIAKMVFDRVSQNTRVDEILPFISYKEEIYKAANEHSYYPKRAAPTDKQLKEIPNSAGIKDWWNYDNRWSSMKDVEYYWADLILANGKQVLDDGEYNTINGIILSLTTHKFTKHLFVDSNNIDIVYQFPMFWDYQGTTCKGLIDHLIIDHSIKRIRLIDEKTLGDYVTKFSMAVKVRRYDIQGAYYYYGLERNLEALSKLVGKDVTGYSVAFPAFIVESTIKQGVPLIFPMTEELVNVGTYGNGKYLVGWMQAIDTYKEWEKLGFSLEKKYEKTNGIVRIDENFEIS